MADDAHTPMLGEAKPPPRALIHPLSAAVLVAVDSLWGLAEWNALAWPVSIPLSFVMALVPIAVLQRLLRRHSWGKTLLVAFVLALLAATPLPVMGTGVGLAILALAGLRRFGN